MSSVPAVGAGCARRERDAAGLVVDAVGRAGRGGGDDRAVGIGDAARISRRRTFFTDLNIFAVAWRTATKSGWSSSSLWSSPSTRNVVCEIVGVDR